MINFIFTVGVIVIVGLLVLPLMGRTKLTVLEPFVNLEGVSDYELEIMDTKRAESEQVKRKENYPKLYKGGKTGVLLIHGFTGAPYELAPLAEYLHEQGFTVYQARVAGHGSSPENLNELEYDEWYDSVKYGYFVLKNNCDKVIVLGQSMGALVAVNTVVNNGADGLIMLAPCIEVSSSLAPFSRYIKRFKKYEDKKIDEQYKDFFYDLYPLASVEQLVNFSIYTRRLAKDINIPVLMFQHKNDKVVRADSAADFFKRISSKDKKAVFYEKDKSGYHALARDKNPHREQMFSDIKEWINGIGN
jgi:carboxylesterase